MKKTIIALSIIWICMIGCKAQSNEHITQGGIKWLTFEEAVAKNEKVPKKIFIDFYTSWCGWCKVLDRNTFVDSTVIRLMNDNFYAVKFDAETPDTITFKGNKYGLIQGGRRGVNQLAYEIMQGQLSYPSLIILNENYEIMAPIRGYQKPEQLDPILKFIGENIFQKMTWDEFTKTYTPQIRPEAQN